MPSYQPVFTGTVAVVHCSECFALLDDKDKYSHDAWHLDLRDRFLKQMGLMEGTTSTGGTPAHTHQVLGVQGPMGPPGMAGPAGMDLMPAAGDKETDGEMLRRLLREVMELSQRMDDED